jgi:hypothetical protein
VAIIFISDDDYGQKTVSVLLNNQETDLEVIDHPACEMSVSNDSFVLLMSLARAQLSCCRQINTTLVVDILKFSCALTSRTMTFHID